MTGCRLHGLVFTPGCPGCANVVDDIAIAAEVWRRDAADTGERISPEELAEGYRDLGELDAWVWEKDPAVQGDPDWLDAHAELVELHREKSATYGTDEDALENFTGVAAITCSAPEVYVVQRMIEKLIRAVNMLAAGEPEAIQEYMDVSSLALCAEALRRRRL